MNMNELIRKVAEAINQHDLDAYANLYARNAIAQDPFYDSPLKGREKIKEDLEVFITAFPDLQVKIFNTLVNENTVAVEFELSGTNKGVLKSPSGAIPATNKKAKFGVASFSRVDENGLIQENNRYYDVAGLLQQLGLQAEQV